VKQLEIFFRTFWLTFISLFTVIQVEAAETQSSKMDSIEIGLITCTPHEEVYSLYGHTALRYHNLRTGQDLIFNYGVFNFNAPHFVARFVLGKTDYELGVIPMKPFCKYYQDWGSAVYEQVLNLTNEEKERITLALSINMLPENRVYRYNFFYDNCSTRPRDIIENNLTGEVIFSEEGYEERSYREMIHDLTKHHSWASFGNDILLGFKADTKAGRRQREFLPMNLMHDFDHAQIYAYGEYRQLVKERRTLVKPGIQIVEEDFPLSPTFCALILLAITFIITVYDWKKRHCTILFDAFFMLTTGLTGCLLFVMLFSEHPATSTNLQLLLFNPMSIFFIPSIIKHKKSVYWNIMAGSVVLFLLGAFVQDYAEGTEILALCLLSRYWIHRKNDK
jgi:hypothetical protein